MKFTHSVRSKIKVNEKIEVEKFVSGLRSEEIPTDVSEIEILVYDPIENETQVKNVHRVWKAGFLDEIKTPSNIPRESLDAFCKRGSRLIEVSYIVRRTGGMSSYYCFDGYFISLIVSPPEYTIVDARGEKAS